MTLVLTRADIASVLTQAECVDVIEQAFRDYGEGRIAKPQSIGLHASDGTFHIKAAMADVFAAKINANFPGNAARHGLPTIQGLIVLMDLERGTPLAILDSALITALRTAAATAVAARYLARADATVMTVIGCGLQGRASVEAMLAVRPIAKVYAIDTDAASANRFARELQAKTNVEVDVMTSIDDGVAASDIVVTCTTARAPILDERHLHRGLFIAGVGADSPEKHELAPALLRNSRVVVDLLEQAATMGDLHHALDAGVMRRGAVHGELSEVVCSRVAARVTDDEMFVFDSTGTALQDVAVASVAYARAVEKRIGLDVAFA